MQDASVLRDGAQFKAHEDEGEPWIIPHVDVIAPCKDAPDEAIELLREHNDEAHPDTSVVGPEFTAYKAIIPVLRGLGLREEDTQ